MTIYGCIGLQYAWMCLEKLWKYRDNLCISLEGLFFIPYKALFNRKRQSYAMTLRSFSDTLIDLHFSGDYYTTLIVSKKAEVWSN